MCIIIVFELFTIKAINPMPKYCKSLYMYISEAIMKSEKNCFIHSAVPGLGNLKSKVILLYNKKSMRRKFSKISKFSRVLILWSKIWEIFQLQN